MTTTASRNSTTSSPGGGWAPSRRPCSSASIIGPPHHTFDALPGQHARFTAESKEVEDTQAAHGVGLGVTDEQELAVFHDPAQVAAGRQLFAVRCAVCHGASAQGVIGPNLTDDYWLHGGKPSQIVATITNGVPDKGMVTWKGVLSPDEIKQAAAYVMSIHGSKPAGAKAPQGALEAWTVK
jgi:cytochrome c oxidase cbb3-type subunit 3